jgi:hypothetical protein
VGGHVNSSQVTLLQEINLVGQSDDMAEFKGGRLFTPRHLKFREMTYERREAGFVVLAVEPHLVPSLKGNLHRKVKEAGARADLETHAPDNLAVSGTRLAFQEKVILEQWKIRWNAKKCFTEMDEFGDLKNGVGVKMDQFNLVVIKEYAEEIAGWEAESALKGGGKHHNFIRIGCRKVFTSGRAPLQHDTIREKVICIELADLTFIYDRWLKQVRVWGGHGWEEVSLRRGIELSKEMETARKKMRNGGSVKSG